MSEELNDQVPIRAIVPNLITATAACAGITSIAFCSEGRFTHALYALLVACVCDGMDGRVARLLNASSKLGAELDSLADFVNFGVAPAMFMFFWLTGKTTAADAVPLADPVMVRIILGSALYYAMCDCFRLARFNTMLEQETAPYWTHFFTGVPAPGGCWMVLTPAVICIALDAKGNFPQLAMLMHNPYTGIFMMLFVGSLMASRLPTISLKHIKIHRPYVLPVMAVLLFVVACLFVNHWLTIGVLGIAYIFTIPVTGIVFLMVKKSFLEKK